jgi:DNA-directed RNA polymerase subunit RPC12/RpoP
MENFVCMNCKFKFRAESAKNNSCPYCGKGNSIEKEKSAMELVDEVADLLEE